MTPLNTDPNLVHPDDLYEALVRLHDGRSREESEAINARLVLLLANHVGDGDVLAEAIAAARDVSLPTAGDSRGDVVLHHQGRSSASYRVRIALGLLGLPYRSVLVDLRAGAQHKAAHLALHPQGLVPVLQIDGRVMTQSLAIIEYLHETRPGSTLMPADAPGRARVRAISDAIAMEIQPLCNLSVTNRIVEIGGGSETVRTDWATHHIGRGLAAVERLLDDPATGLFCHGDTPTMADCCLVPQLYNAARYRVEVLSQSRIAAIARVCADHPAFAAAHPDAFG